MRILFVNTLYPPNVIGGAERSVASLAEKLAGLGHDVLVATTAVDGRESIQWRNGVQVHLLPHANVYSWPRSPRNPLVKAAWHALDSYNPFMAARLRRVIRSFRPEVVHTNTIGGFSVSAWGAAHSEGVPVTHTLRDYYLLCPRSRMFEQGRNCATQCGSCSAYSVVRKMKSHRVDAVVGVSRYTLERHLAAGYFREARVTSVVHNIYEGAPVADVCARPPGKLTVGYLGQIHPSKGLEQLLEAAARTGRQDLRILVAGKGNAEYEQSLRARFQGETVSFLGFVPPENLLGQIDALAVPALWQEPLPRIVFEAYSYGVPVLAARRGGIPEIVEPGATGHLYEPDRPGELEELLANLEAPECAGMRERCLVRALDFSSERISGQYLSIYEQVMAQAAPEAAPAGGRPS